jgi:beta-ureidopropionase / N-carbamoyl-L-amino-acid hydrolase
MIDRAALRIDGDRLLGRLDDLARVGDTGDGGVSRLALTDDDRDGRDLVVGWMEDLGLAVTIDRVGNVVGLRAGRETGPAVMTGSHIDTVATGGRYDGNLGVLAGLEVVAALNDAAVTTRRPLAVAFFTDEEGSRFPPDMLGSLAYAGGIGLEDALDATDHAGHRLGDELQRIGYSGVAPVPGPAPHAFVELHIEQGPCLEAEGIVIGAVTGVQGISWQEVRVRGQANHAGTTPMHLRHDAGWVAAELAARLREVVAAVGEGQVATVGSIRLEPDLINVVARSAELTVDLRHPEEDCLAEAERQFAALATRVAEAEGVTLATRQLARFAPVQFDQRVIELVERAATVMGHSVRRIVSGAGHDAQMLARMCPAGMIFVPSRGGISHNPAEHTDPEHLVAGAQVLLAVVLKLTEEDLP